MKLELGLPIKERKMAYIDFQAIGELRNYRCLKLCVGTEFFFCNRDDRSSIYGTGERGVLLHHCVDILEPLSRVSNYEIRAPLNAGRPGYSPTRITEVRECKRRSEGLL
jgi:hypothetical protein